MAYYLAGDYYRAGGGRNYAAGGLFGKIGGFLGKAVKFASNPLGTAAGWAVDALTPPTPQAAAAGPPAPAFSVSGGTRVPTAAQAARGITQLGVSHEGTVGIKFKKSRRMNPGNARAARRAISRIKGVRHLLQSIERELPRRPAVHHAPQRFGRKH